VSSELVTKMVEWMHQHRKEPELVTDAAALDLERGYGACPVDNAEFVILDLLLTRKALRAMVEELADALGYHRNEMSAQEDAAALLAELRGEKP